jgi:hypothetical protein
MNGVLRIVLDRSVPVVDAEMSLELALLATEGLFGEAAVRTETSYHVDRPHRVISVDARQELGQCLVRILAIFLLREFGNDAFQVQPVGSSAVAEARR